MKFDEIEKKKWPFAPDSGARSKSQTFEASKDSDSHNTKVMMRQRRQRAASYDGLSCFISIFKVKQAKN